MHKCLLLIALLPGVPQGYSQSSSTASGSNLDAGRSSGSIRLDGRLDEIMRMLSALFAKVKPQARVAAAAKS